jgi:hypothetical protein
MIRFNSLKLVSKTFWILHTLQADDGWQKTPPAQRKKPTMGIISPIDSQLSTTGKLQETESIPLGRLRRYEARHITSEIVLDLPLHTTHYDPFSSLRTTYLSVRSPFDTRLCSLYTLRTVFHYSRIIWVVPFPVVVHR